MPLASLVTLLSLAVLVSCGPSLTPGAAACGAGRTELDGVCVREAVADYVACVRAQGAQLSSDRSRRLSAEAGQLGVRVGGAAELRDTLEKQYSVSSASELEIIRECGRLAGAQGMAGAPPPPGAPSGASPAPATGAAGAPPPSTGQPAPPAAAPPKPVPAPPPPSAAAPAGVDLTRGLLGWWRLNEADRTNVAYDWAGSAHLRIDHGVTWARGKVGGAVHLGGGDHRLDSGAVPGPHSARELSLSLWIHQTAPELGVLVFKGTQPDHEDSRNREYVLYVQADGRLVLGFVTVAAAGKHGIYFRTPAPVVAPQRWVHVAAVISSETGVALIYVDGQGVARADDFDRSGIRPLAAPLWLGNGFSGQSGFEGLLDEVRIYGRALSADEVAALARGEQ